MRLKMFEKQKKNVEELIKNVEEEKETMEGLRGLIECPVCMEVPQVGEPVPGMFVFKSGLRFSILFTFYRCLFLTLTLD